MKIKIKNTPLYFMAELGIIILGVGIFSTIYMASTTGHTNHTTPFLLTLFGFLISIIGAFIK